MKPVFRWWSLRSKGLRQEMAVSFGLVILVILVLVGYLFPGASFIFQTRSNIIVVVFILFIITILGFSVIAQMVEPVIKISHEAKRMAEGNLDRQIRLFRNDEIGEMGIALNNMSQQIKENLEELKVFSEKTELINAEINKRILTLSGLVQIGNLVSQNADLNEIITACVEKCLSSGDMTLSCLVLSDSESDEFTIRSTCGPRSSYIKHKDKLKVRTGKGLLGKILLKQDVVIVDRNIRIDNEIMDFQKIFSLTNAVISPVVSGGKSLGLLIAGNNKENFSFSTVDYELVDLLSKQISIAIENDSLAARVRKLETIDQLTGLFNNTYMQGRLDEEILRAIRFQRPCALILLSVDRFDEYRNAFGHLAAENALIRIGDTLKENIAKVDKLGRFEDHEFALISLERNKRQSIKLADEMRKKIESIFSQEEDTLKKLTVRGAVAENPLDGMVADELISKAKELLKKAKDKKGNEIYS